MIDRKIFFPKKSEYISNIIVVDGIVRIVDEALSDHFKQDNQTAFIFTADHGMTDWGNYFSMFFFLPGSIFGL